MADIKIQRSPRFPSISLERALSLVQIYYEKYKLNATPFNVAATGIGYSAQGGAGLQVMASIGYYGLWENEGTKEERRVKLSQLALKIIADKRPDSSQRTAAILEAALNPPIFRTIKEDYSNSLPTADALQYDLIVKYKFNPSAVSTFVNVFRSTMEFAEVYGSDNIGSGAEGSEIEMPPDGGQNMQATEANKGTAKNATPPGFAAFWPKKTAESKDIAQILEGLGNASPDTEELKLKVSGQQVRILIPGKATRKFIERLIAVLDFNKDDFPEEEEKEESMQKSDNE